MLVTVAFFFFLSFFMFSAQAKTHKASSHRGATTYMKATAVLTEDQTFDVLKSREITPKKSVCFFVVLPFLAACI